MIPIALITGALLYCLYRFWRGSEWADSATIAVAAIAPFVFVAFAPEHAALLFALFTLWIFSILVSLPSVLCR